MTESAHCMTADNGSGVNCQYVFQSNLIQTLLTPEFVRCHINEAALVSKRWLQSARRLASLVVAWLLAPHQYGAAGRSLPT
jgi:hypothetical protein